MQSLQKIAASLTRCFSRKVNPSTAVYSNRPVVSAQRMMSDMPAAPPGAPPNATPSYGYRSGEPDMTGQIPGLASGTVWNMKSVTPKYPALAEDTRADVVVVGAGIAGLTCAYQLAKAGKSVVVLEARVRGGGQTGRTTAHIMTWLDDYYYECESMHGLEKTKLVADSLRKAVDWIENVTNEEKIDCKFERLDGYLVPHATGESPMPTSSTGAMKKELDASIRAGLTDTEQVQLSGGPEVGGYSVAIRYPNNADFHPMMYIEGLADAVVRHGGRIYENTKYWTTEGDQVATDTGRKIKCDAVVLATNSPINHNLAVHARQLPYRSYAVGIKIPKSKYKRALYWDTSEPYHYVRIDEYDADNYVMIVGGEDHKTGSLWPYDPYERLIKYAKSRWTGAGEVLFRWNGQVMEPADLLYLHGKDPLKPDSNTYIITGDSGQGMTGGTIGGIVVSDEILGRPNPWAEIYSPSRAPPAKSLMEIADEGLTTTVSFAERVIPKVTLSYELEPDSGAIVQKGLHKVALYVDAKGEKHAYSAVCKHMGCIVHWNSIEKTFDCPCHGSHFSCYGKVIQGPAKADLDPVDW